jgi:hypothetical protein
MSLSRIFEERGVPVVQHKFRKVLMGNVGSKPRLLTLTKNSSTINMVKRSATALAPSPYRIPLLSRPPIVRASPLLLLLAAAAAAAVET